MATKAKPKASVDVIDMDAARAARREVKNEMPTVKFGGKMYNLPVELPMSIVNIFAKGTDLGTGDIDAVVKGFLGNKYDQFMSNEPSVDDVNVFIEGLMKSYGTTPGKSGTSE